MEIHNKHTHIRKYAEGIQAAVEWQRQVAKDRDEATAFMTMLRRWNGEAYKTVDAEMEAAMAEKKVCMYVCCVCVCVCRLK